MNLHWKLDPFLLSFFLHLVSLQLNAAIIIKCHWRFDYLDITAVARRTMSSRPVHMDMIKMKWMAAM